MKTLVWGFTAAAALASAQAAIWDVNLEVGGLNGNNESTPNLSPATGGEVGIGMWYDDALDVLGVNVAYGMFGFTPLTGLYTASHIHQAPAGVPGPVVINLAALHTPFTTTSGFYSGSVPLTPALETALFAGDLYLNIHSTTFPGGEIRGQLTAVPEPATAAWVGGLGLVAFALRRAARRD